MKTQLLQDLNESGSAEAGTGPHAAAPPAPAPVSARAAAPAPAAPPAPTPAPEPTTASAPAGPATLRPRGFAPQPPGFGQPVPPREDTTAEWSPDTTGSRDPDWLKERLARETAMHDRSEWTGGWTRHLATWGAAGVLLALLAGGGLWLYEQRQVDGALVVVANTNPTPDTAAARPAPGLSTSRIPNIAPVSTSAPIAAAVEPAPRMAATPANADAAVSAGAGAVGGLAGPAMASGDTGSVEPVRDAQPESASRPESAPKPESAAPKRQRSQVRRHPKAEASAAIPDSEPSARQRREETLMQCRAHGYDDQQCVRRGCEMTKYGFACKG